MLESYKWMGWVGMGLGLEISVGFAVLIILTYRTGKEAMNERVNERNCFLSEILQYSVDTTF